MPTWIFAAPTPAVVDWRDAADLFGRLEGIDVFAGDEGDEDEEEDDDDKECV